MSKELAFTDDNDVVKYLDTTTAFNLALTADGVAFDLTNAKSILVKIANNDGYIMQQTIDLTTVTSLLGGTLSFPINQDIMNTLVPDDYDIEVWVTMNDGTQAIFPSDGTLGFSIEENLMSDTGEVIPTITLNDFQQQFNDLSNQMENAVHNVQKGDKGDTGTGLEIKDRVSSVSKLPPTANEGDGYLVGEELYVRVNGAWKDCGPLQGPKGDQGIQGIQGNTGTGISSTTIQYQISSSATTAPTGIWSNSIIATTTTNPYLWMKATLNYTDHTTKVFYLVSQKGDKGDTGPTGPIGPIGPRGPVGSGLVVKGTVTDASQLPKIGNQEGYCYFVGTDLYVWDVGAWKNCGSVSPDLSNYVTITDLNNGLNTKVTDNKDGTEQLNGVRVQPYNKLSDTIGGRNLVKDSEQEISGKAYGFYDYSLASPIQLTPGKTYTISCSAKVDDKAVNCKQFLFVDVYDPLWHWSIGIHAIVPISTDYQRGAYTFTIPEGQTGVTNISAYLMHPTINGKFDASADKSAVAGTGYIKELKLEQGSIATDWTPAPEDKVTDNHDNTITANNLTYDLSKTGLTPLSVYKSGSFNDLPLGTVMANATKMTDGPDRVHGFTTTTFYFSGWGSGRKAQIAIADNANLMYFRVSFGTFLTSWTLLSDDSKVAHLSGANNFDTVPTVDKNPLLLANSLPSDLARTGSNQEFTGKNTFDTAPIDKTTGNPYITKDGVPAVPSTLADTTKDANFTGKLQKSGIDVATTTDVNKATTAANAYTDNKIQSSSDTGWVDAQTNFEKQTTDWLKQRVKNGVLYIIGNMYVSGSESSLIGYMAVKINPSWKLPTTPIVESYYDNMSSEIISSTNAGDRTGKAFLTFNNSASVSEGYLLSFVSTSGNAHNLGINLAIPID